MRSFYSSGVIRTALTVVVLGGLLAGCGSPPSSHSSSGSNGEIRPSGAKVSNLPIGFPNNPDNRLGPDLAPAPYTAEQIRRDCPAGRKNTFGMISRRGTFVSVQQFVSVDAQGAQIKSVLAKVYQDNTGTKGSEIDPEEVTESRFTWAELQSHASYPAKDTTIAQERIQVRAGSYDCWRYEVREGATLSKYWFPREIAGPPVKSEVFRGDELLISVELTELQMP